MDEKRGGLPLGIMAVLGALAGALVSYVFWIFRTSVRRAGDSRLATGAGAPGRTAVTQAFDYTVSRQDKGGDQEKVVLGNPPSQATIPAIMGEPFPSAPPANTNTRWTDTSRYIAAVGLGLALLWLVIFSRGSLLMIVFAGLIAFLVQPIIVFLKSRAHFSTGLAVGAVYVVVALLLIAVPLLILPNLAKALGSILSFDWNNVLQKIVDYINLKAAQSAGVPVIGGSLSTSLASLANSVQTLPTTPAMDVVKTVTVESLLSTIGKAVGLLVNIFGPLISGLIAVVFMVLISLQMNLAAGDMRGWLMRLIPERFQPEIGGLLDRIMKVWSSFLTGQLSLMVVMGLLVWLLNLLLGTPHALFLGFLAGLLEVIPSLGPILAAIPAAILALVMGSSRFPEMSPLVFMLILMLGYALLNAVENQTLVPRILGGAVSLPPLVVLIGVLIAGKAAGIAGVFLAAPLMASGREIFVYVYDKATEAAEAPPAEDKPGLGTRARAIAQRLGSIFRRKAPAKSSSGPQEGA